MMIARTIEDRFKNFLLVISIVCLSGVFEVAAHSEETDKLIFPASPYVELKPRPLPERYNMCQFCHTKKEKRYVRKMKTLTLEHPGKSNLHGKISMSCNLCHDINNHNFLRSDREPKASFAQPSPVCYQCHAKRYIDWARGVHGKRVGKWDGVRTQYNCIDCHDPHSIRFKPMETVAEPARPKFLIEKHHEEPHEKSNLEGNSHTNGTATEEKK